MTFTEHPAEKHVVEIYDDLWYPIINRYSQDVRRVPHEAINMLLTTGFMFALMDLPDQRMWRYDNMPAHKRTLWVFSDLWKNIAASSFGCKLHDGVYVTDSAINSFLSAGLAIMSGGLPDCIEQSRGVKLSCNFI